MLNGNVDVLPVLGFILPPYIGLFLVAVKPQMGIVLAFYWLVQAWREGGGRRLLAVGGPITAAMGLSFLVFGVWPLGFERELSHWWNASLWPLSIPVGLALTAASIRLRNERFAFAASPCLSPYVLLHAWSGALISVVSLQWETIAAVVGLWIVVALRAFGL